MSELDSKLEEINSKIEQNNIQRNKIENEFKNLNEEKVKILLDSLSGDSFLLEITEDCYNLYKQMKLNPIQISFVYDDHNGNGLFDSAAFQCKQSKSSLYEDLYGKNIDALQYKIIKLCANYKIGTYWLEKELFKLCQEKFINEGE